MADHTQFLGFCDENLFEEGPSRHGTRQPGPTGFIPLPLQYSVPADRDFTLMTLLIAPIINRSYWNKQRKSDRTRLGTRTEVPRRVSRNQGGRAFQTKGESVCLLEPVIYGPGPGRY